MLTLQASCPVPLVLNCGDVVCSWSGAVSRVRPGDVYIAFTSSPFPSPAEAASRGASSQSAPTTLTIPKGHRCFHLRLAQPVSVTEEEVVLPRAGAFCAALQCVECDGLHPLQYWWWSQFGAIVSSAAKHIPACVRGAQRRARGPRVCAGSGKCCWRAAADQHSECFWPLC